MATPIAALQAELMLRSAETAEESSPAIPVEMLNPAPASIPTPAEALEALVIPKESHIMTDPRISTSREQDAEARYWARAVAAEESREAES